MKKINWNDVDVKTILEMHQKSGYKSSLLNELVEPYTKPEEVKIGKNSDKKIVAKDFYTIGNEFSYKDLENATKGSAEELRLMTGTKFVKSTKNPDILVTTKQVKVYFPQNLTGKINGSATVLVYYNCKEGKFGIQGNTTFAKYTWYDEEKDLVNQLIPVCRSVKSNVEPKQDEVTPKKDQGTPKMGTGGKSGPIKMPDLTGRNVCNLRGDKVWSYAKMDDGTWYASKDKENWFKLELPKYQKAVDLLSKDAICQGLEPIAKLETIPATQISSGESGSAESNLVSNTVGL